MNRYSDSESQDSDEGIRFKTQSVRKKQEQNLSSRKLDRNRSRSPKTTSRISSSSDDSRNQSVGPELAQHLEKNEESQGDETDNSTSFGPLLPPHLLRKTEEAINIGPQLPDQLIEEQKIEKSLCIGPQLPPHLLKKKEIEESFIEDKELSPQKDSDTNLVVGPQLPPHLLNKQNNIELPVIFEEKKSYIGPTLPVHLRKKLQEQASAEESEDETYGPLPAGSSNMSKAQIALEERALQLKMDQLEPEREKPVVREEWMLELPQVKASKFGLGPRQFRAKAGPDLSDRSSWTDTPDKKKEEKSEKKVDLKKEAELKQMRKRDEEQEKISKKLKKKNKESLLDMHQSKMKKKKKEEPTERRPFSRDIDLQVNRFDEAQKKAVLKKAQLLDDRFSSGQSKFL